MAFPVSSVRGGGGFAFPSTGSYTAAMGRIWITIVTQIGGFSASILSIWLGYRLFVLGATGTFKFSGTGGGNSVGMESVAPGLAFALFGAIIAVALILKTIGGTSKPPAAQVTSQTLP